MPTRLLRAARAARWHLRTMRRFARGHDGLNGAAALPVADRTSGRLAGLLSRSDVLAVYGRILAGAPGAEDPSDTTTAAAAS